MRTKKLEKLKKIEKWLYEYDQCKTRLDCLKMQLENLSYLQGMSYDKDKLSQSYKFVSTTENTVCRTDDLKAEIHTMEIHIRILERAINYLNEIERKIIELKYFDSYRWFDISDEVNLSVRRCIEIRNEALHKIQEVAFMKELCTINA